MPRYARKRKPKTYRPRRNKRRARGKTVKNTTGGSPLPTSFSTVLTYGYSGQNLNANPDNNRIRLNSVYDPEYDNTSNAHQPMGFDTMITMYNRYLVTRADVNLKYTVVSGGAVSNMAITVFANNLETAMTTSYNLPMEQPFSKKYLLTQALRQVSHKASYYPARITGATTAKYNIGDTYSAQTNANPVEFMILHSVISDPFGSTLLTGDINVTGTIKYHVKFWDPLTLGSS